MANHATTVRDYCTVLVKSKLLPADQVEAAHARWKGETQAGDDQVEAFRRHLVDQKLLTGYQAVMIQRGHSDGFFLGGYKILDRIGKGQMGGVYRAVHELGQTVALKILSASKAKDPHILGRFQREARLLTQLNHPNIVRAFQVGDSDGIHYIVMELLEGETLDVVLARRKKLPPGEAVRIVHQALAGLQHMLDRRIVHRDLKPANLMLISADGTKPSDTTWNATVKILDIGLGREMTDGPTTKPLTAEGAVLGTPDYLAPEQAKDARTADTRADIYSLGCVLYHCLAGRPPFPDGNIMTQMLKHATEAPVPIAVYSPSVTAALQAVVDKMIAKNPFERFASASAAADALKPHLTPNAGTAPQPAVVIPAYKDWLASESIMEKPDLPPALPNSGTAVLPSVKPAATTAKSPPTERSPTPTPPSRSSRSSLPVVDVELVTVPPQVIYRDPEPRPLWQLDRRDLVMLGIGGLGVLAAVGLGYGLAKVVRSKPDADE